MEDHSGLETEELFQLAKGIAGCVQTWAGCSLQDMI